LTAPDCVVLEAGGVLGHAVGELVTDDVDRSREPADSEDPPAAVAVHHLRSIPERVVEGDAVMNGRDEFKPLVVDAVPTVDTFVELVGCLSTVICLVDGVVG